MMYWGPSAKLKMNSDMTKNTKPLLNEKNIMAAAMQFAIQKVSPDFRVPSFAINIGANIMPGVNPMETMVSAMPWKLLFCS